MSLSNALLINLDKVYTTEMGAERVKNNLSLDTDDVVEWCKGKIESPGANIVRKGKNWYVSIESCVIIVNAYSYTIITAHKEKRRDKNRNLKEKSSMKLRKLVYDLTVCKVKSEADLHLGNSFYFIGKTADEISLVCITADTPINAVEREDGWKGFLMEGVLDFSLVGILSKIAGILAENHIGIFAVSTFNTDYILVKNENFEQAMYVLANAGYEVN